MPPRKSTAMAKTSNAAETSSRSRQPRPHPTEDPMPPRSVLVIGSEAVPFSKTGGLADVLGALPTALARLGWNVTLVVPKYRGVHAGRFAERFTVTCGGFSCYTAFFEAPLWDGALAVLVDCPKLYDRDALYGVDNVDYPDNALRFAFLARAALEYAARRDAAPDVVHAHDWQAGLAPVYLNTLYADHPMLGGTPSVFTIHNLAYQGLFEPDWLPRLDLGWELFTTEQLEYWGRISYLKGGINHSEFITTVSKRYAKEIQTPEFGFGFDGILGQRSADLVGIMNGIDVDEWNPAADSHLPAAYGDDDLRGKAVAKRELLARYGFKVSDALIARPIIGMISRLVDQKGLDLIAAAADRLMALDATWIVLGTGEARYEDLWTVMAARHPDRAAAHIGFDEGRAHLIEAGAD